MDFIIADSNSWMNLERVTFSNIVDFTWFDALLSKSEIEDVIFTSMSLEPLPDLTKNRFKSVSFYNCKLGFNPMDFSYSDNLKTLRIIKTEVDKIFNVPIQNESLTEIELSDNKFKLFDFQQLAKITNLKVLRLNNNSIDSLQIGGSFVSLETLHVVNERFNSLQVIPEILKVCPNIKTALFREILTPDSLANFVIEKELDRLDLGFVNSVILKLNIKKNIKSLNLMSPLDFFDLVMDKGVDLESFSCNSIKRYGNLNFTTKLKEFSIVEPYSKLPNLHFYNLERFYFELNNSNDFKYLSKLNIPANCKVSWKIDDYSKNRRSFQRKLRRLKR